ncbi:MAG: chemotaxis protein CheW [Methylococcaceae bacterium]
MEADYLDAAKQKSADWPLSINGLSQPQSTMPANTSTTGYETALGFRVGGIGFLVAISIHCELIERLQVSPLPNVEPWFSGLLNIRGNIVPVIDLRLLLGETAKKDNKKRYLFAIDRGEKTMAFWIDGHPEMLNAVSQPLSTLPVLPAQLQRHVSGGYAHNGEIWLNVQFEELFKSLGRHGRQYAAGETA